MPFYATAFALNVSHHLRLCASAEMRILRLEAEDRRFP